MATLAKICKQCFAALPPCEPHDTCIVCLGVNHDVFGCDNCAQHIPADRITRRSLIAKAKKFGSFPDDWAVQLYGDKAVPTTVVEVSLSPAAVPTSSAIPSVAGVGPRSKKSVTPPPKVCQPAAMPEVGTPSMFSEDKSVEGAPSVEEIQDPQFVRMLEEFRRARVASTLSLPSISSRKRKAPVKKQPQPKKAKSQAAQAKPAQSGSQVVARSSTVSVQPSIPSVVSEVPPVVDTRISALESAVAALTRNMQAMSDSFQKVAVGLGMQEVQAAPQAIPKVVGPPRPTVGAPVDVVPPVAPSSEHLSEDEQAPSAEFVTQRAQRGMWLSTLRELVPELPYPPHASAQSTSMCFSGLSRPPPANVMPLLPELVAVVAEKSKAPKPGQRVSRAPFKWMARTLPCVPEAEKSFFHQRTIPRRLVAEVPSTSLETPGTSGSDVRLKKASKEAALDDMSKKSFDQSTAYLRLANSQELTLQGLKVILQKLLLRVDLALGNDQYPPEVQELLMRIQDCVGTAQMAVTDLDRSNTNLTRCGVNQMVTANRDRLQAWLSASTLPEAFKKQLGTLDLAEPIVSQEPLSILGSKASELLQEFSDNRKDDAYRAMLFAKQPQQKQKPKQQPSASFAQSAARFNQGQSFGRGRGSSRGQGKGKGRGKGRGASKPSATQSRP